MRLCDFHSFCGLDALPGSGQRLCILHSRDPGKDPHAFSEALDEHRKTRDEKFFSFVFPRPISFHGVAFERKVDFLNATFEGAVYFGHAQFKRDVSFKAATFNREVCFNNATFEGLAHFEGVDFRDEAEFRGTRFKGPSVSFRGSGFGKRVRFTSGPENPWSSETPTQPIFAGGEADLRAVRFVTPEEVLFLEADFRRCRFQDTDVRKVHFVGVIWPEIHGRFGIYDEIASLGSDQKEREWGRIETLCRGLKQNYEERRDYERAGDFHYGEKEMRRNDPRTPKALKLLLMVYWAVSGYGEQFVRPLLWAGGLFVSCTLCYLFLGLKPRNGLRYLDPRDWWDWLRAAFYSFRVMTLLKPEDLEPVKYARAVYAFQSLMGPVLFGLFALAVRQRLRR